MFDAEMNMGFKMKLLGGDDITNGEEEYSTGLITGRDAEANTNNEDNSSNIEMDNEDGESNRSNGDGKSNLSSAAGVLGGRRANPHTHLS